MSYAYPTGCTPDEFDRAWDCLSEEPDLYYESTVVPGDELPFEKLRVSLALARTVDPATGEPYESEMEQARRLA